MMILSMPPGTVNIDIGKTTLYYVLGPAVPLTR